MTIKIADSILSNLKFCNMMPYFWAAVIKVKYVVEQILDVESNCRLDYLSEFISFINHLHKKTFQIYSTRRVNTSIFHRVLSQVFKLTQTALSSAVCKYSKLFFRKAIRLSADSLYYAILKIEILLCINLRSC